MGSRLTLLTFHSWWEQPQMKLKMTFPYYQPLCHWNVPLIWIIADCAQSCCWHSACQLNNLANEWGHFIYNDCLLLLQLPEIEQTENFVMQDVIYPDTIFRWQKVTFLAQPDVYTLKTEYHLIFFWLIEVCLLL